MSRNPLLTPRFSSSLSALLPSFYSQLTAVSNSSCLQTLVKKGLRPIINHIDNHLLFLCHSHRFNSVINFFSQIESNKINPTSSTYLVLTWALISLHKYEEAEIHMRTVSAKGSSFARSSVWDILIHGYCIHQDDPEKGLSVVYDCLYRYDILPSSSTFCSLIHSFCSKGMMGKASAVLELMSDRKVRYPLSNFVCTSMISGFCKIGKPELGVDFFKAKVSGVLRPNIVTYTVLVDALCRLGRFDEIPNLLIAMEDKGLEFDVVFFTCLMCGYIREGDLPEAFRKNKQMLDKGVDADTISYTVLIDGFSKHGKVEKVFGFLAKMIKEGLKPNLVTYTVIISGLCRNGKLKEALSLFKTVEDTGIVLDDFIYATLIDGACMKGDFDVVFKMLDDMEKKGISPSIVTYNTLINGLCKFGRTFEADEFSKGLLLGDVFTYSTLLNGYIVEENVSGVLEIRRRLEKSGLTMDIVMCNVLLKASFIVGAFGDADALYKGMADMDLIPNDFTYSTLINGYLKVGKIGEAFDVFEDFRSTSSPSVACYNSIIHGLCKNVVVDVAIDVLIDLSTKGLPLDSGISRMLIKAIFKESSAEGVLNFMTRIENFEPHIYCSICNEAIQILCKRNFPYYAFNIYKVMMRGKNLALASESYYLILRGLIDGERHVVEPLLCIFFKEYVDTDSRVVKILINYLCLHAKGSLQQFIDKMKKYNVVSTLSFSICKMLINRGKALDAYALVKYGADFLPNMDVVDYASIIDALCKEKYLDEALDLCTFLRKKSTALNIVSYNSIINALCLQGRLVEAFQLYDSLERINLTPSKITYATLIDTLCREGLMHDAESIFQTMVSRGYESSTHTFNSILNGYGKIGKLNEAMRILEVMEKSNVKVDEFTVSSLINGYCQKGDMEGALGIFFEFKEKGVFPDFLGFLYLVRGLITKGRMEEARNALREMLQSKSFVEQLTEKIPDDNEVSAESVYNLLNLLCDQGNLDDAIMILNEIGIFPTSRLRFNRSTVSQRRTKPYEGEETQESMMNETRSFNFDSFYSKVVSLCSMGELNSVNSLLKSIFS